MEATTHAAAQLAERTALPDTLLLTLMYSFVALLVLHAKFYPQIDQHRQFKSTLQP